MPQSQAATSAGTLRYRDRFSEPAAVGHFRASQGLWMSSIRPGSCPGDPDEKTDASYRAAVSQAALSGCNVFDTAANYRFQRGERCFGAALYDLMTAGLIARDEIIVTMKGGYIPSCAFSKF